MITHNVLLVDDEKNVLSSLQRLLRKEGYCIFLATNGVEGLNVLAREKIALIVSDQQMPKMDGIEFLTRAKTRCPHTIRIMLTSQTNQQVAINAINSGNIYRFITKPWNDLEFIGIIREALKKYELIQENISLQECIMRQNVELLKMNENLEEKVKERTKIVSEQKDELIKFTEGLERMVEEKTEQLRAQDILLLEMDRIVGIATLAAGIAHEINNPLSVVKSSIGSVKRNATELFETINYWENKTVSEDLLKDYKEHLVKINSDSFVRSFDEKFDRIANGIERIMKIVNSLRSFSRVDREDIGKIDINQSIEEAIDILSSNETKNITFVKELQELPQIECYANKINQCLLHTMKDGIDAISGAGTITIKTSHCKEDEKIIIQIVDDGKGMSQEVLRQAFNPFFTTKAVGSGTGVGLSLSERVIKDHGGRIHLLSEEGAGTTVTICLPVVSDLVKVP